MEAVGDYAGARLDAKVYARFFHAVLERGFYLPPSQFEPAFLSLAHDESHVDAFVRAADEALASP